MIRRKTDDINITMHEKEGLSRNISAILSTHKKDDAEVEVFLVEESLEAWGDFYPAVDEGAPLSKEYIQAILDTYNISYGIQEQSIDEALHQCNEEKQTVSDVLLARGDAPINETAQYIKLNPRLDPAMDEASVIPLAAQNAVTKFIVVKKDQVLGRLEPSRQGKDGKNVHGGPIPYSKIDAQGISGAENTRMEGRFLVADIDGQMVNKDGVISVQPNLEIKGAIGQRIGNIIFPGDINIDGPVSDGFKIYSGGSVSIKSSFDVSDAITKGDLTVGGGIVGKGVAHIKVGGSLKTKSIENCHVACRKTVSVRSEIINSFVFCLEKIECERSRIIGGEIWAFNGLRAATLERISGHCPRIHCGIDFASEQEKDKNNNMIRMLSAKLGKLRTMLDDPSIGDEKKAKLEELRLRLLEDQKKAAAAIVDLLGTSMPNENAAVEIIHDIVPGTLIEICKVAMFIAKPLNRVRIRLDKANNKLVTEAM